MPRKPTLTPLAARLTELGIEPRELSELVRRPLSVVEQWIAGDTEPVEPLLRWLNDPEDAARRISQLRRKRTRSLKGEGTERSGIDVPYGTSDINKVTGGLS